MDDEHEQILRMVEEGTISAEEAQELLDAMDEPQSEFSGWDDAESTPQEIHFQKNWQRPFNISLVTAVIGGSLWFRTRKSTGLFALIRTVILLPLMVLSLLTAVITYISKDGPWLHVRVRSSDGDRISLSLPFPLNIVRGGLRIARSQIDDDEIGEKVDAVADMLETLETSDFSDPVSIDIMDNGDNVQIYFG